MVLLLTQICVVFLLASGCLAVPGLPSSLSGTPATYSVQLTWGAATPSVNMYMVYKNNVYISGVPSTALTYTVTGLTSATTYQFGIAAMNSDGEGSKRTISVTTTGGVSSVPGLTAAAVTSTYVSLSWNTPTGTYVSIRVYRGSTIIANALTKTTLSYYDSGVTAGTTYVYAVCTVNGGAEATKSYITVTTLATPPASVPGLSGTASANTVQLTWGTPTTPSFTMFMLYRDGKYIAGPEFYTRSYLDSGLVSGVTYTYAISAMAATESAKSTISITTQAVVNPCVVPNVYVTCATSSSIQITWDTPTGSFSMFMIYRDDVYLTGVHSAVRTYIDVPLSSFTTYKYSVAAMSDTYVEGVKTSVIATTLDVAPGVVTSITIGTLTPTTVELNWGSPLSGTYRMYMIYRDNVFIAAPLASVHTFTDTGLTPQTTYTYTMSAMNSVEGERSNVYATTTI